MIGARSAAMTFNRIVDRDIDARNPRTANRELPTGELSVGFAWLFLYVSIGVFLIRVIRVYPRLSFCSSHFPTTITYQILTLSCGARYSFCPGFTLKASYHASMLRTVAARY